MLARTLCNLGRDQHRIADRCSLAAEQMGTSAASRYRPALAARRRPPPAARSASRRPRRRLWRFLSQTRKCVNLAVAVRRRRATRYQCGRISGATACFSLKEVKTGTAHEPSFSASETNLWIWARVVQLSISPPQGHRDHRSELFVRSGEALSEAVDGLDLSKTIGGDE